MSPTIRVTPETVRVVEALAAGYAHGFDILDTTGLASGTVYPILRRLDAAGLVRSRWEEARAARADHRPPRRYYELTAVGHRFLTDTRRRGAASRRPASAISPAAS